MENLCRICFDKKVAHSIDESDKEGQSLRDKLVILADIPTNTEDRWPNKICEKCYLHLEVSYEFRQQCRRSIEWLQDYFAKETSQSKSEGKLKMLNIVIYNCTNDIEDDPDDPSIKYETEEPCDEDKIARDAKTEMTEINSEKVATAVIRTNRNQEELKETIQSRIKKKADPISHTCSICGNFYRNLGTLTIHMRRHLNDKPYSCEICGHSFVVNRQLTCHMRTHTGEKPFECRFCKRRYADVGAKQAHERTHTGERPFQCDVCKQCFTYSSVLRKHKLIHTDEKQYRCHHCNKEFRLAYHLKAHLNTMKHQSAKEIFTQQKLIDK